MSSDSPFDPYEALEPSLTALLLGELNETQAQLVRRAIEADPVIARKFEQLKYTISLVTEIEKQPPAHASTGSSTRLTLDDTRRQQLLQHFKTVRPEPFATEARRNTRWLMPAAAGFALLATVIASMIVGIPPRRFARLSKLQTDSEHAIFRRKLSVPSGGQTLATQGAKRENEVAESLEKRDAASNEVEDRLAESAASHHAAVDWNLVLPQTSQPASTESLDRNLGRSSLRTENETASSAATQANEKLSRAPEAKPWTFSAGGAGGATPQQAVSFGDSPQLGLAFSADVDHAKEGETALTGQSRALNENALAGPVQQNGRGDLESLGKQDSSSFFGYLTPAPKQYAASAGEATSSFQVLPPVSLLDTTLPQARSEMQVRTSSAPNTRLNEPILAQSSEPVQQLAQNILPSKVTVARDITDEFKKEEGDRLLAASKDLKSKQEIDKEDLGAVKSVAEVLQPQPEIQTTDQPFSTFSLNVSDVSFQLAAASLAQGKFPEPASIRSEEFINAFDYRDPEPAAGQRVAFSWNRAASPLIQNRDLLRFSIKTAVVGREAGRALNVVLLLDNSGSMERADRVKIIHEALRVMGTQLRPNDTLSVITFARNARLFADGVPGDQAGRVAGELDQLPPQGGTNLEEAMNLAYATALRHYLPNGINRVVLLTDGAANLGDTNPEVLKQKVGTYRKQGVALDCFGIGWEGYNDDLIEQLTRHGDGRYGFLNTPEQAASEFAEKLAGALQVSAADVKAQVEFNPARVKSYRQIGYARHQLQREQFRDNSVDAAELGGGESGNALYLIETNPEGHGPVGTVRVRYKVPGTTDYEEHEWTVPFTSSASSLEKADAGMRLAFAAGAFAEWLAGSPYAAETTPDKLLRYLNGVTAVYGADPRPQKLQWMIQQAKALGGK
jgi:Mg-chelatase subunit ChlD/anti-sigma factor RsiW